MGLDPLKSQSGKGFKKYINLIHGGQSNVFCRLWFLTFILHLNLFIQEFSFYLFFYCLLLSFNLCFLVCCPTSSLYIQSTRRFLHSLFLLFLLARVRVLIFSPRFFGSGHDLDPSTHWLPGPTPFCPYSIEFWGYDSDPKMTPKRGHRPGAGQEPSGGIDSAPRGPPGPPQGGPWRLRTKQRKLPQTGPS